MEPLEGLHVTLIEKHCSSIYMYLIFTACSTNLLYLIRGSITKRSWASLSSRFVGGDPSLNPSKGWRTYTWGFALYMHNWRPWAVELNYTGRLVPEPSDIDGCRAIIRINVNTTRSPYKQTSLLSIQIDKYETFTRWFFNRTLSIYSGVSHSVLLNLILPSLFICLSLSSH